MRIREALVQVLYLWTRDAKIDIRPNSEERFYIENQVAYLGDPSIRFSDKEREQWARQVVERIEGES